MKSRTSKRNNSQQPILPSTKESFEVAWELKESQTNIYGWDGEVPAPGYYRQGGTEIWIFEKPQGNIIGLAR